mmetsp:Transcript_40328/g.79534  ORF Transcript_40328/g.79534 Transcript_40328/m.79534 type:complete len:127 (+) Transcript_40328:206-586(+)
METVVRYTGPVFCIQLLSKETGAIRRESTNHSRGTVVGLGDGKLGSCGAFSARKRCSNETEWWVQAQRDCRGAYVPLDMLDLMKRVYQIAEEDKDLSEALEHFQTKVLGRTPPGGPFPDPRTGSVP